MGWLPKRTDREALTRREYRERAKSLRLALLELQSRLRESQGCLVVVVAGVDGAGKGDVANQLSQWLDPRWIRTRAFDGPSDEERERPPYWRYWRSLPPRGSIALFLSAWYSEPLLRRVEGADGAWLEARLEEIRSFERTLSLDGTAVLKLWLHLDRKAQQRRLEGLAEDPHQSWRVTRADWDNWERYDAFVDATEEILSATHAREAPWVVIDGSDAYGRALDVGDAVLRVLRRRLESEGELPAEGAGAGARAAGEEPRRPVGGARVAKAVYRKEMERARAELGRLHRVARERDVSLIGVFEGRDAAGKGGAIRRLAPAFDARRVDVVRVGPPSDEERAHHYLWRFWRRLPRAGHVTLFDRSWYGRVLVERVEALASPTEWGRAYDEINDFERQLVEHGSVLLKFWLDVSAEEQEVRFEERRRLAVKRWKLTDDDLRNRALWDDYDVAIGDMLSRTHRSGAPWHVIPADDKRTARTEVLQRTIAALRERLGDDA